MKWHPHVNILKKKVMISEVSERNVVQVLHLSRTSKTFVRIQVLEIPSRSDVTTLTLVLRDSACTKS